VLFALCGLFVLGGCSGDLRLVAFKQSEFAEGWHQYITPRQPKDAVEEAVLAVAESHKSQEVGDQEVHFIVTDYTKKQPVQCVVVVSKSPDKNLFTHKAVTRYRIFEGKIAAMSDSEEEFFIDAEMERAVLRAVAKTWTPDRVLVYNDGTRELTMASHALSNCSAAVSIFKGEAVGGKPLAEKTVQFCFAR
jgi:alpha-D-ribose 1-methylphosphonate 5-triphosphate diphosphatase PhnM